MKNKQHKYILKAYLQSRIPAAIRQHAPQLILVDSVLGGYCTQLIRTGRCTGIADEIISKDDKMSFSELINRTAGTERDELLVYYRLTILVELVLMQYR